MYCTGDLVNLHDWHYVSTIVSSFTRSINPSGGEDRKLDDGCGGPVITLFSTQFRSALPLLFCSCTQVDRATALGGSHLVAAIYHRPLSGWRA